MIEEQLTIFTSLMVLTISISEEEWKLNPSFLNSSLKKAVTSLLIKELKS